MGADQNHDWHRLAASALEWWRDAGVDVQVGDDPFDWLAPDPVPAVASPDRAAPATAIPAAQSAPLPATLDAFLAWRIGPEAPEAQAGRTPFAPSGPGTAELMILVDVPERDDRDSLLEGEAGRLFGRMLAAIGHSRADVHLASVCTVRPTGGRVSRENEARLGEIARHHAALAAPKRLLVMGDAASRAVLSANVADSRGRLHSLNHKNGKTTAVVASFTPRFLLERPAAKAEAWRDLQLLIGGNK